MAKKVTENHNIATGEQEFEFADMIDDDMSKNSKTTATSENTEDKGGTETDTATEKNADKENILVLKKAATYTGCGLKFTKGIPTLVEDKTVYEKLLKTGLFVKYDE